jgi:orotate phosphoribosyltransferase
MDDKALREELLEMVRTKAIIKGDITLSSGQKSGFYIDGKQVTLDPRGLFLMGKVILNMLQASHVDAIGGPTLGADPIAAAVALLSCQTGKPINAFIVRKEAKKHGTQKMIEGPSIKEGDRVVMVEDVVTTGGSILKAIQEVESLKAKVVKIICLLDRKQGGSELLGPYNYCPIFHLSDLNL